MLTESYRSNFYNKNTIDESVVNQIVIREIINYFAVKVLPNKFILMSFEQHVWKVGNILKSNE